MAFLVSVGILFFLLVLLFTGGVAALPIVLFVPVIVIIVYILWILLKRVFTAHPQ